MNRRDTITLQMNRFSLGFHSHINKYCKCKLKHACNQWGLFPRI